MSALLYIPAAVLLVGAIYCGRIAFDFNSRDGDGLAFLVMMIIGVLNWFDTGQCLARTPDGHWTRNTNIIVNVPAKP